MKAERRYLKALYCVWAKLYDDLIDKIFSFDRKVVIDRLELEPGARVLEIGVGTGLNLPFYPARIFIVGIDFSSAMLKKARKKSCKAHVDLVLSDAHTIDYPDAHFTHALATYVLRVTPSPTSLLKEMSRVMAPGGKFIVLDQFQKWNWLTSPLKLTLGWGHDFLVEDLLTDSPWKVVSKKRFGAKRNTWLLVLRNG